MADLPISSLPLASTGYSDSLLAIVNYNPISSGRTEAIYFSSFTGSNISISANTGLGVDGGVLYTTYNTLLDPTISMASAVGGLSGGTTVAQLTGKTFVSLFDELLFPTEPPTYTIPTISIGGVSNSTVEVGSNLTSNITVSSVKNDAGIYNQLRIFRDGTPILTDTTLSTSSATDIPPQFGYPDLNNPNSGFTISPSPYTDSYTIPAPTGGNQFTTTTYNADGNYLAGVVKKNNKGTNDPRTPLVRSTNAPQDSSNNFATSVVTYTGIYPFFYGVSSTLPNASSISSAIQANSANKVLSSASGTINITFAASSEYLWFAHFSNYTDKTVWFVDALNSGGIGGSGNLFGSPIIQSVTSPSSYWSSINFDIYISNYQTTTTGVMQLRNS
jgi:hypothetical protein